MSCMWNDFPSIVIIDIKMKQILVSTDLSVINYNKSDLLKIYIFLCHVCYFKENELLAFQSYDA